MVDLILELSYVEPNLDRDMLTLHLNTGYNLLTTCTCACMFYVRLSLKVHRKQQKYRLLKGNDLRHVC